MLNSVVIAVMKGRMLREREREREGGGEERERERERDYGPQCSTLLQL